MKVTVLGSGTSHGIPVVGCGCPVCASDDPRDKRMRSSIYIEGSGGECILIDAGPEFRLQALRAGIRHLDAILLTHAHADHIHGLDDVRPLSREQPIPVYGNEQTITEMEERFSYIFGTKWGKAQQGGGKPRLSPRIADSSASSKPVRIGGLSAAPVPVKHGILDILGWELQESNCAKSLLYLTDTSAIPPSSLSQLLSENSRLSRVIIIGGLRKKPHETHFSFDEALNAALGLGSESIYLTHICHEHSHEEIEQICLAFRESRRQEKMEIHPARDGLELVV